MEHDSELLADVAQRHILHVLKNCNGDRAAAANVLGLARSALALRLKDIGALNPGMSFKEARELFPRPPAQ